MAKWDVEIHVKLDDVHNFYYDVDAAKVSRMALNLVGDTWKALTEEQRRKVANLYASLLPGSVEITVKRGRGHPHTFSVAELMEP